MILRRRFADVVRRQLDLFAADRAALLRGADEAERAYDAAAADEAEERYGDFQLVLETIADELAELRSAYAATLDAAAAEEYERAFARAVRRRFPRLVP